MEFYPNTIQYTCQILFWAYKIEYKAFIRRRLNTLARFQGAGGGALIGDRRHTFLKIDE